MRSLEILADQTRGDFGRTTLALLALALAAAPPASAGLVLISRSVLGRFETFDLCPEIRV